MSLKSNQIGDLFICSKNEDENDMLANILDLNLNLNSNEKLMIATINTLLSSAKTRQQGLEFLNLIINNCSSEIISTSALGWMNHCLVKYPGDSLKEIKLITIGKIVANTISSSDFAKKFVAEYISKVLEICLSEHNNPNELEASLDTLTICMKFYASWFASHKSKIESFLEKFLDQRSEQLVEKAAVAFLYIQQVGNAGIDGNYHKSNFSNAVSKLCATLHHLYKKFFENDAEFDRNEYNPEQEGFIFRTLNYDSQKMLCITSKRITNCLKFIMIMLRKSFPVSKEINPEEILDVVNCGLNVHRCLVEKENTLEDCQSAILLIGVQTNCLQLLRILIIWGQSHLIPYTHLVSKILINALDMYEECNCISSNRIYQEAVYKALSTWVHVAKSSLHSHFQDNLVTHILQDITPIENSVKLNIDVDLNAKSRKAKRKAVQEKIIVSGIHTDEQVKIIAKENNRGTICLFALGTLKQLMTATDLKIKPDLLKKIYSIITGTLLDISYSKIVHPYTNPVCQEKLYEILMSFYEQSNLKTYPHLQLTLTILSRGALHHNRHIALTCEHGLSNLEKLCQPLYPPLYTPAFDNGQPEYSTLDISFESETRYESNEDKQELIEAVAGEETLGETVSAVVPSSAEKSPIWSEATEELDNDCEEGEPDQEWRVSSHESQDSAAVTVLQNEIISPAIFKPKDDEHTEEPYSKKIKLSLSTLEENVPEIYSKDTLDQPQYEESGQEQEVPFNENISENTLNQNTEPPQEDVVVKIEEGTLEEKLEDSFIDEVKDY